MIMTAGGIKPYSLFVLCFPTPRPHLAHPTRLGYHQHEILHTGRSRFIKKWRTESAAQQMIVLSQTTWDMSDRTRRRRHAPRNEKWTALVDRRKTEETEALSSGIEPKKGAQENLVRSTCASSYSYSSVASSGVPRNGSGREDGFGQGLARVLRASGTDQPRQTSGFGAPNHQIHQAQSEA